MSALKPDVDSTHDLGTTALRWRKLWVDEIATTDAIAIGGNLTVTGNLQVDGATTTINSTTLTVDDKNIVVASGAAAAANWTGSGLTVDGANATLLYTDDGAGTTQWEFSDDLELTGDLLPESDDSHSLGSLAKGWADVFVTDGGTITFANADANAADLTLTHSTGALTLSGTDKLQFSDANSYIRHNGTALELVDDGTITVTTGGRFYVNAAQNVELDTATGIIALQDNASNKLVIDLSVGVDNDVVVKNGADGLDIVFSLDAGATEIMRLDDSASSLLMAGTKKIEFGDAGSFVHQSADGKLKLSSDGAAADAVIIHASDAAGGIDIDAGTGGISITSPVVDIDASTAVRISNDLELDSDAAILKFGADGDVSLTHVADTGLLLNAAMALQFRDADLSLSSSADGQLDIDADTKVQLTTATAELAVTALDVNASGAITLDGAAASNVTVDGANLSLGTTTSGELDLTSAGLLDINGGNGVDIDATGQLHLDGSTGIFIGTTADVAIDMDAAGLDIDASGAITIDGTSTISIGGAAAAGDISIGTNATARNITVGNVTGATALKLDAGSGGILIGDAQDAPVDIDATTFALDASSTINVAGASTLYLDGQDSTRLKMTANAAGPKVLTVQAINSGAGEARVEISAGDEIALSDGSADFKLDGGTILADAAGVLELNSSAGVISIGNDDVDQNINIGTDGERTIVLGTDSGVGSSAPTTKVDMNAATIEADATTKILLDSAGTGADAIDINSAGGLDVDVADVLSLTTTSGDGHIELVSAHTAGVAFHIDANANASSEVQIDAGILDIDVTGAADIDAGGALSLQGGAGSDFTTGAGALTLDGAGGVNIAGNASEVDITTTGALDINSGAATIDVSTLSIDSTDTTNLTMTADVDAERVLTIDAVNSNAGGSASAKIVVGNTSGTAVQIGHSTSEVTIGQNLTVSGNLTVQGTQTIVDTVTMEAANAIRFDGATGDDNVFTTLTIIDPDANRTIKLPNQSGCLPVLAVDSNVAITATPAELNYVDVTPGTAAASKALVLNASSNIASIGTIGCGAITSTDASSFGSITTSERVQVNDVTEATNTTDGSLQTDGGLSVAKSAVIGDDLDLLSDEAIISFGGDKDVTLTHVHDTGLLLNDDSELQFRDAQVKIKSDADGHLRLEADNTVKLVVDNTAELSVTSTTATFGTNIVIPDDATIGSASDTDALQINASGDIAISSTTASSSPTTGALKVSGGLGVNGKLNVAQAAEFDGQLKIINQSFFVSNVGEDILKFKVDGANGNTTVGGTLTVGGTTTINGNIKTTGGQSTSNVTSGGARDMDGSEYVYLVTSDNVTVTLPEIGNEVTAGQRFVIKRTAAHSAGVTIARAGTNLIDGGTSVTLGAPVSGVKSFIEVISDGTNYHIITSGGSVTVS